MVEVLTPMTVPEAIGVIWLYDVLKAGSFASICQWVTVEAAPKKISHVLVGESFSPEMTPAAGVRVDEPLGVRALRFRVPSAVAITLPLSSTMVIVTAACADDMAAMKNNMPHEIDFIAFSPSVLLSLVFSMGEKILGVIPESVAVFH